MAGLLRIDCPGEVYNVTSRGNERRGDLPGRLGPGALLGADPFVHAVSRSGKHC